MNRFTAEQAAASAAAGERTVSDFPDKASYQDWFVSTITSGAETLLAPGDPGRAKRWKAVWRQHGQIEQARTRKAAQRATDESEPAQPAQQPHRPAIQRDRYARDKREEREAQRATGLNRQERQEQFRVTQQRLQMRYFLDQARSSMRYSCSWRWRSPRAWRMKGCRVVLARHACSRQQHGSRSVRVG